MLGDLRRLPFRKGAYPRAYSLDVLEHLDEEGVREVLRRGAAGDRAAAGACSSTRTRWSRRGWRASSAR